MWAGVLIGLAKIKFSGSPNKKGFKKTNISKIIIQTKMKAKSLAVKNQWKEIKLYLLSKLVGFWLPVLWRKKIWIITRAEIIKGIIKWSIKKRERVGEFTLKPPHNQVTMCFPKIGIAETKFVITVAPQNLICPQGKTYPKKAVAIERKKITTPIFQVSKYLKDL